MKRLAVIVAITLVAASSRGATPPEEDREADQYYQAGKQAYQAGQYLAATVALEEAYRLAPDPQMAFTLAQAQRNQYFVDHDVSRLRRALELYRRYLAEEPRGRRRAHAVMHIATIEDILAREPAETEPRGAPDVAATQLLLYSSTAGATMRVDDGEAAESPLLVEVTAGMHRVRVDAAGHFPADVEWLAVDGRLVVAQVELRPRPARISLTGARAADVSLDGRSIGSWRGGDLEVPAGPHTLVVSRRGRTPRVLRVSPGPGEQVRLDAPLAITRQRVASYGVLGATGVALVAGAITTGLAFAAQDEATSIQVTQAEDLIAYNAAADRRDSLRTASVFLLAGAAALGVTGAALYWFDNPRAEAAPPAALPVQPAVGPDMIGATWSGVF